MMHRTCLIFNPTAGGRLRRKKILDLHHLAPQLETIPTSAPGDGRKLAAQMVADGCDTVIAAGGDGSINDVLNGIADAERVSDSKIKTRLAILPFGTANVFARELGIPLKFHDAWKVIERNQARTIDIGRVVFHREGKSERRFFCQLAGIGFDARACEKADLRRKKLLGPLEYVWAGLKVAVETTPQLQVEADGAQFAGTFVAVGNGRLYGGPFKLFPRASNDDGRLDITVFQGRRFLDSFRYALGVMRGGRHVDFPDVKYLNVQRLRVTSGQSVPLEVDGEWIGHTPAEFDVLPRALDVLAP